MKRIIEGKTYNTATAEEVATFRDGTPSDWRHVEEALYVTKKGAWFLAGAGGPMSGYAVSCGNNSWSGGSGIHPLSRTDALAWLERNDETDVIEEYFAEFIVEA